jgi:hypothetical protein
MTRSEARGDEHHRGAVSSRQAGDQLDHLVAGHRVERPGRLVGQDQPPAAHDRAGNGDALLLAAREVVGEAVELLGEPDRGERLPCPRPGLAGSDALELERQHHVLERGE